MISYFHDIVVDLRQCCCPLHGMIPECKSSDMGTGLTQRSEGQITNVARAIPYCVKSVRVSALYTTTVFNMRFYC